jgi:DNA-binding PadR family transcriptional regulator
MIEELSRHGYRLSPGTLYPLLATMERKGLLRSSRERLNGKFRRTYRATPAGRAALRIAKKRVKELFGELFEDER